MEKICQINEYHICCNQDMEFFGIDGNGSNKYWCSWCHEMRIINEDLIPGEEDEK